jgi:phosphoesterase RecJ-like protein
MAESIIQLDWGESSRLIKEAQRIILVTHVRPDGDAIGSMCALGMALRDHGKAVTMAVDGGVNRYLNFVPGSDAVLPSLKDPEADLVIFCDAGDITRAGDAGESALTTGAPTIVIDHHNTNTLFGTTHLVHSEFVSTTEAVLRLLDFLGWELTPEIATALMVGYMTDTISFRVGPVTGETLKQVGRLMEAGAPLREVTERMLIQQEPGQLELMGKGLSNLVVKDHVGWTYLRLEDFAVLKMGTANKPELSTEILRDARVYVAAFFIETEEGDVRLSIRATAGFDIGSIAAQLGGGGHTLAAGATLQGMSIEQAIEKVIPLLHAEAKRGTPVYK